jgi:hypothetical protein
MSDYGTIQSIRKVFDILYLTDDIHKIIIFEKILLLRKTLKIKAFAILFGWLIIFMHGIIPHNHLQEHQSGCHELFHTTTNHNSDFQDKNTGSSLYSEKNEDEKVCHFSSFLFNNFNQDNLIITPDRETYFFPPVISVTLSFYNLVSYLSEPYYGSISLRAPPACLA